MLNFLFVYSSGCHQAAQRGFAGPSEGMGKSVCLAFLGWALGSAGSVDLEVSLTSAEVGAWAYPLTSARAKFKSLMAEMSPVVTQWWVWKGMREKKKRKKNPNNNKKGEKPGRKRTQLWHVKNGENKTYWQSAVQNMAWRGTKGFVPLLSAGRCVRSLHQPSCLAEEQITFSSLWTLQRSKRFALMWM